MRTSTLALVASALVVASCGQQSMSGVDAFRTVAEAHQAGRSAEAAVILETAAAGASTTAGYDRRTEKAKRKAVAALSVPYTRRYRNGNGKDKTA